MESKIERLYKLSKSAKVGDVCKCPSCGKSFIKSNYQQAFCKTKKGTECKDKYWNTVTPNKKCNTTRISPASKAYLQKQAVIIGFPDHETRKNHIDDFDGSWDSHGCNVGRCDFCKMKMDYCDCDD